MKNFKEYMPPLPGNTEEAADCPAEADGYLCTRDSGHDGEHRAHGIIGILATWEDDDE